MTCDELIPGIAIVKELPPPDDGVWPYSVFEVRDDRNGAEYSRTRIAYRFGAVSPHVQMNLFGRLQQLSSQALPAVAQGRPEGTVAQLPVWLARRWVVERCHALGLRVDFWTVNDPAQARHIAALGADGIMTDDPATIVPALRPG